MVIINRLVVRELEKVKIQLHCGQSDSFIEQNEALHKELLFCELEHDYSVAEGGHDWVYWNLALREQLITFKKWHEEK